MEIKYTTKQFDIIFVEARRLAQSGIIISFAYDEGYKLSSKSGVVWDSKPDCDAIYDKLSPLYKVGLPLIAFHVAKKLMKSMAEDVKATTTLEVKGSYTCTYEEFIKYHKSLLANGTLEA